MNQTEVARQAGEMAAQDVQKARQELLDKLESGGLNVDALIRQFQAELEATKPERIKLKKNGAKDGVEAVKRFLEEINTQGPDVDKSKPDRPAPYKIIYETSEEILIELLDADQGIRREARRDLHRIRGDYAAEQRHITGSIGQVVTFDSISQEERDELLAASRFIQANKHKQEGEL